MVRRTSILARLVRRTSPFVVVINFFEPIKTQEQGQPIRLGNKKLMPTSTQSIYYSNTDHNSIVDQ